MQQHEACRRLANIYGISEQAVYIPQSMIDLNQWILWKYEYSNKRKRMEKHPYRTDARTFAETNNPKAWASFDEVIHVFELNSHNFDGIGFVFTKNDSLVFVDIDHCISDDGNISETAADVLTALDGQFMEYSQSGTGIHVISLGTIPEACKQQIEMYSQGRFVACTFKVYKDEMHNGANEPSNAQAALDYLFKKYKPGKKKSVNNNKPVNQSITLNLSDDEILSKARNAANGSKFISLYDNGDLKQYGDDWSDADQALCNMLAFWTDCDTAAIDRLFRTSALMRNKWDEPHYVDGTTYGARTIANAIKNCSESYSQYIERKQKENEAMGIVDNSAENNSTLMCSECTDKQILKRIEDLDPLRNSKYRVRDGITFSLLFADTFGSVIRYNVDVKKWYFFNGIIWEAEKGTEKVNQLAMRFSRALQHYLVNCSSDEETDAEKSYKKFAQKLGDRSNRMKMIDDARSHLPCKQHDFDTDTLLLNVQNGVIDLATGEFMNHHPGRFMTKVCNCKYNPGASSAAWEKFINEILEGNKEKIAYLQRVLGYSLTGETAEDEFYVLWGALTRNGKSTMLSVIQKMLGNYTETINPEALAQDVFKRSSAPSPDIAKMEGTRLVHCPEPRKGLVLNSAMLKRITGGDPLPARYLNQDEITFIPRCKLFINTNYKPQIDDMTLFDSYRVQVISFDRHFDEEEQDKTLRKKLQKSENLSGLLNWCLVGLAEYQQTGMKAPDSIKESTKAYRNESDYFGSFIDECLQQAESNISMKHVFDMYKGWCRANNITPSGKREFAALLKTKIDIAESGTVNGMTCHNVLIGWASTQEGKQYYPHEGAE